MKRILIVRLSSLGDVLHTFPAVTDIRRVFPDANVDWAVEETYLPLVRMHPGVTHAIPFALRRWRSEWFHAGAWREFGRFRAALRAHRYDAILDTQGLLKSALVAKLARGPVHGFGPRTAREPFATRCYATTHEFAPADHKIERYRAIAARALGYTPAPGVEYGIVAPPAPVFAPRERYCVLLLATARAAKLWRETGGSSSPGARIARVLCVLPWGADDGAHDRRIKRAHGRRRRACRSRTRPGSSDARRRCSAWTRG
jgi:heptosyltransferase-1